MLTIIETTKEDAITKIVRREQEVVADQYDQLKAKICDQLDEQKLYHVNRIGMLAEVLRNIKVEHLSKNQ